MPDIAVDPRKETRNIYLVWQDARFAGGLRDQIALVRSSDGGKTWTTPRRVSSNLNAQAFTASVEVNDRGHVGVTYYDFSRDNPTAQPPLTGAGYFVGDYEGLDGVGRRFHPVFGVTRNQANPVDIVSTIARPPFGPNTAALQADATAAARTATARSSSHLGLVTLQ